ncbi:MAG: EAL domain-containing protein [Gemmatimonadota bacterium]|nr:EAL domain-containing protein [Gemmatimonadota bacterium]
MHPLLRRQLKRALGDVRITPELSDLLNAVSKAYEQSDADRATLERALDLSSAELNESNSELRELVALLEATLDSTEDGVLVIDGDGTVVRWNRRFEALWRMGADEIVRDGTELIRVLGQRLVRAQELEMAVRQAVRDSSELVTAVLELRDGRFLQLTSRAQSGLPHQGLGRVWSFHDLTEIKQAEKTIRHFAYHDALTGLPNRALFEDRLSVALTRARRTGTVFALLFIDLDRFKNVNDTLGHSAGDQLLREVALRLQEHGRSGDVLARFGGDEFVFLLQNIRSADNARRVAERLLESMRPQFELEGRRLHVTASIGVAMYPTDGQDRETLLRKADAALYSAKDRGRNTLDLYRSEIDADSYERLILENELRSDLREGRVDIALQPIVCAQDGRVVGGEALARWTRRGQPVPPGRFIPIAEESELIDELGEYVLAKALTEARRWSDAGHEGLRVSVNVSPRQLQRVGLDRRVLEILDEAGVTPERLQLEVTESQLMQTGSQGLRTVNSLAMMGIRVALDDFGTGYSSLRHLRELPIKTLKIDRSFIRNVQTDPKDRELVATVVALAHSMDLNVVAEGAEDMEQVRILSEVGCDAIQGFALGRPETPDQFMERLARPPADLHPVAAARSA